MAWQTDGRTKGRIMQKYERTDGRVVPSIKETSVSSLCENLVMLIDLTSVRKNKANTYKSRAVHR